MESKSSTISSVGIWEVLALVVSISALTGSLYLSIGLNLKACPLCIYERTFMMGLVGVLLVGVARSRDAKPGYAILLGLPLAVAGLCVAGFHVYLELNEVLECPTGLFGLGSAPQQSMGAFLVVTALAGIAASRSLIGTERSIAVIGSVILGIVFAGTAIKSAPPLPKPPSEPYTTPLEGCRPTFDSAEKTNQHPT